MHPLSHKAMRDLVKGNNFEGLSEQSQRTASVLLQDFEQSGIFLPDELRSKVVELNDLIQQNRMDFEHGVGTVGTAAIRIDGEDLIGAPRSRRSRGR